jgi:hypothetical protein
MLIQDATNMFMMQLTVAARSGGCEHQKVHNMWQNIAKAVFQHSDNEWGVGDTRASGNGVKEGRVIVWNPNNESVERARLAWIRLTECQHRGHQEYRIEKYAKSLAG